MHLSKKIIKDEFPEIVNDLVSRKPIRFKQTSTRGDGSVKLIEYYPLEKIKYQHDYPHLHIHLASDKSSGSKFAEDIKNINDITQLVKNTIKYLFPSGLPIDQHKRCEITVSFDKNTGKSSLISLTQLGKMGVQPTLGPRVSGAGTQRGVEEGVVGTWIAETEYSEGKPVIKKDGNPKFKFQADNFTAIVKELPETNEITFVFGKDKEGIVTLLTVFPGKNSPALPSIINYPGETVNTLKPNSPERIFWDKYALLTGE